MASQEGGYVTEIPAYESGGHVVGKQPFLQISVVKVDNGYQVSLYEPPKPPSLEEIQDARETREREAVKRAEAELCGAEEKIDAMIEGICAFARYIQDKAAGEDWKKDEVKEKIRTGFKAMFPSMVGIHSRVTYPAPLGNPVRPRSELKVFEAKEALLKFLTDNL